jgi:hypothetical protein
MGYRGFSYPDYFFIDIASTGEDARVTRTVSAFSASPR